jgi:hypothetical protein
MADFDYVYQSIYTDSGDDIYIKYGDSNFSGSNWGDNAVALLELNGLNRYGATLDNTKNFFVYRNSHQQSFVADAGTDVITANDHGLVNGQTVYVRGTDLPEPLVRSTIYFVRDVTTHTFRLAETSGGGAINLTDAGTGVMYFTAPSLRSIADEPNIGLVLATQQAALTPEGEAAIADATVEAIIAATHIDQLFAAEYDPSNKPGDIDSLLNALIEGDVTPLRFTLNAIESVENLILTRPAIAAKLKTGQR